MIEIQCLACGKSIKPRQLNDTENYDTDNYDGQVLCQECKSWLYVKLIKGKVQKCKPIKKFDVKFDVTEVQKIEYVPAKVTERQELGDKPKREKVG